MGSTDYLNSARRAAIVFSLLAIVALGAAGFKLAALVWDAGAVAAAPAPAEKHNVEAHRRTRLACAALSRQDCATVQLAFVDGLAR